MIVGKINAKRVDQNHVFRSDKGDYVDFALFTNRDGKDERGNDGFIVQSVSKEAREKGEKGPIIGNWKEVGTGQKQIPKSDGFKPKDRPLF